MASIPWLACFSVPQEKTITVFSGTKNLCTDLEQTFSECRKGALHRGSWFVNLPLKHHSSALFPAGHLYWHSYHDLSPFLVLWLYNGGASPGIHQLESRKNWQWLLLIIINLVFVSEASFRFDKNLPLLSWMVRGSLRPGEHLLLSLSSPGR